MQPARKSVGWLGIVTIVFLWPGINVHAAAAPSVKQAFSFKPIQTNVDYETPRANDFAKCRITVERSGKKSGWVVTGPNGHVLRRFIDTNGDNIVDQWRFFNHGLEVYRDIDTDFNSKVDQFRWLNTGGTRWGIDMNEDGYIDTWKILSAEEASREVILAMIRRDQRTLTTLFINSDDIKRLGLKKPYSTKLLASVATPEKKLKSALAGSKIINAKTKWLRFDCSMPSTIPADNKLADNDLTVYENAMVIVENGNTTSLLQIGEMVLVGNCWKLTQIPRPLEGDSIQLALGGILMQPAFSAQARPVATTISPQMQKLLERLQEFDRNSPAPTASSKALGRYNARRADLLQQLVSFSKSDRDRIQWFHQLADSVAAAVQTGSYPNGLKRLQKIEAGIRKQSPKSPLVAYVQYRRLMAEYATKMQAATGNAQQQEAQKWWPVALEQFATEHPTSEETPEALWQLGIAQEFSGKVKESRRWYAKVVKDHADSSAAARAAGAIRRIDLKGKRFEFTGSGLDGGTIDARKFRGKVLVVVFWSTWSKGPTEDLPQLQALYRKYHNKGLEILGINLDVNAQDARDYISKNRIQWPQVFEPGGMSSEPAVAFGIITPSTIFLVAADGKVIHPNISIEELPTLVPELLKTK